MKGDRRRATSAIQQFRRCITSSPSPARPTGRRSACRFDVVMAWAIDRIGRSLIDLLSTIQHLEACGVDLYLDQQAIVPGVGSCIEFHLDE